jgi:hypothetical protein
MPSFVVVIANYIISCDAPARQDFTSHIGIYRMRPVTVACSAACSRDLTLTYGRTVTCM